MQIYPNIHNIVSENKTGQGITNAYLVTGTTGSVLIDTGWKSNEQSERIISYINKINCASLKYIIITHRHPPHWGNAEFVKKHNDAIIISTDIEAPYINDYFENYKVDIEIDDNLDIDLGNFQISVMKTPGHTSGTLAVFEKENKYLFPGDTIMEKGTSVINPGDGKIADYLETIENFIKIEPKVIFPGQGDPVTETYDKLTSLIAHRTDREQEIVNLLKQKEYSVDELFAQIYENLSEWLSHLAKNQITSHLIKLEDEGKVTKDQNMYKLIDF